MGEEYQQPLVVTGKLGFESQNRSGFQPEERVVRRPARAARARARQPLHGAQGLQPQRRLLLHRHEDRARLLHKERFTEEVLYSEDQRISPLSSYFELMDRLLPNFLGVITPQKIRGTRVLLR